MKSTFLFVILALALITSLYFNVRPEKGVWNVSFGNANTRPTYDDYHHITEAHQLATGKGIRIGILDRFFGYEQHRSLYAGGKDFVGDADSFGSIGEHGYWMATTLREIAPEAEIYALQCLGGSQVATAITAAIQWAEENQIDILTYSGRAFPVKDRPIIDAAVLHAIRNGMITVFIHYDLEENILPFGFFSERSEGYARMADVNIYHFDYNLLLIDSYVKQLTSGNSSKNLGSTPYFSLSSMSPVLAGIIAMMKETNPGISHSDARDILVRTSKNLVVDGQSVPHVVHAKEAVEYSMHLIP